MTWFCLLYCGRGTLKVKSIRHEPTLLVVLYLGICTLSCIWSISPFQSVMKVAEMVTDFVLLQRLVRDERWPGVAKETMDVCMTVCLLLLAITLVAFGINLILRATGLHPKANYFFSVETEGNAILEMFHRMIPVPFLYLLPGTVILVAYMAVVMAVVAGTERVIKRLRRQRVERE